VAESAETQDSFHVRQLNERFSIVRPAASRESCVDARSAHRSSAEKAKDAGIWFQGAHELRLGARLGMADAAFGATGSGADHGVGARELASHDGAEGAGGRRRHQQRPGRGHHRSGDVVK